MLPFLNMLQTLWPKWITSSSILPFLHILQTLWPTWITSSSILPFLHMWQALRPRWITSSSILPFLHMVQTLWPTWIPASRPVSMWRGSVLALNCAKTDFLRSRHKHTVKPGLKTTCFWRLPCPCFKHAYKDHMCIWTTLCWSLGWSLHRSFTVLAYSSVLTVCLSLGFSVWF